MCHAAPAWCHPITAADPADTKARNLKKESVVNALVASTLGIVFMKFWRAGKKSDHALTETRANDLAAETQSVGRLSTAPRLSPEFGLALPQADDAEPLVREF